MTARGRILLALLAALAAALAYLLLSPAGLALVWSQARPYLPPEMRSAQVSGRLIGPIRIRGLTVAGEGFRLRVARAELDWRPLELLAGDLVFDYVEAEGIHFLRRPGPTETTPTAAGDGPGLPDAWAPPLAVHVRDLDLRRATIRPAPGAEPLELDRLRARTGVGAEGPYVRDLRLESPFLDLTGEASLTPAGTYPVRAVLDWTLRLPDRPALAGHTRLQGNLRQTLTLTQNVAKPLGLRAEARIEQPLERLRWHLTAGAEAVDLSTLGPGLPPVSGGFHLQADGDTASAGGRLTLQGRHAAIGPFRAAADWGADLEAQALQLHQAEVSAGDIPGRLQAQGTVARQDGTVRLDLAGSWADLRWPFAGEARWRSPSGRWQLAGTPANLQASLGGQVNQEGRIDAALTYRADRLAGMVHWKRLRWPDPALDLASPEGELTLSGAPADYRFRLATALVHEEGRSGRISAHGHGGLAGLTLEALRAEVMDGVLTGDGRLGWKGAPEASLRLRADGLDPGTWFPAWAGRLDGRLAAEASLPESGPELTVSELGISGQLRDREVRLDGTGSYRPGRLEVPNLDLAAGTTRAAVSGQIGDSLDIQWRLDSPDLGTLYPEAAGRLTSSGHLGGTLDEPAITARAEGSGLAFAEYRLNKLDLGAQLDAGGQTDSHLSLVLEKGKLAGRNLEHIRLTGRGRPDQHALRLEAKTDLGEVQAEVTGNWQGGPRRWDFRLRRARLDPARIPETWRLSQPAAGSLGPELLTLAETCLEAGEPRLCLAGDYRPGAASARFSAQALPLGYLLPLLPPGAGLEGQASGSGELAWRPGQPVTGHARLTTSAGRLLHSGEGGEPRTVATFRPSHLELTADPEAIRAEGRVNLGRNDGVIVRARLGQGDFPVGEAPVSARIRGSITDFGFVPLFAPEIMAITGRAEADLGVTGRLAEPVLTGRVRFLAEAIKLASPGITVRDLALTAEPGGNGDLRFSGRATSGEGELRVEGTARLGGAEPSLRARVQGRDFLAYDTLQARVRLSPDLTLALRGREVTVDGEVRVPSARIQLRQLPTKGAVAVSPDQEIVRPGETEETAAPPWRVTSRVRLILGDEVRFEGFGLTSRIAGDLTVVDEPGRPTTASGELRTEEGEYLAYGQRLTIETGKLLFGGGPVTAPGLDVRAVRRPDPEVLVGVRAYGPLREPTFELFSEPAMAQAEQLSWLVLGRPLEEASGGEQASLSRAAVILGMKGGAKVAESIGTELGLDEVALETQQGADGDQAALVLGKYLSPRLYVSYGVGLFEPVNTLRMQYTLSEHWRLVTESSTVQSGGDLFYTIETGN